MAKIEFMLRILVIFSFFCSTFFAQTKVYVIDSITKDPIINAQVLNQSKNTVAFTNNLGFFINNSFSNVFVTHFSYESLFFKNLNNIDTIYLSPKTQTLDEVQIKPKYAKDIYPSIIKHSVENSAKQNYETKGKYFEQIIIIYKNTNDTISIFKQADLKIITKYKKINTEYEFFLKNGGKKLTSTSTKIDTSDFNKISALTESFNDLLKYDLTNKKQFENDVKDYQFKFSKTETNKIVFNNEEKKSQNLGFAYFNSDSLLLNWSLKQKSEKKYTDEKMYFNIDEQFKNFNFEYLNANPHFQLLIGQSKITAFLFKKLIEIHSVKGFFKDENIIDDFSSEDQQKNIENYFKKELKMNQFDFIYNIPINLE
jgi:hypothetical protein